MTFLLAAVFTAALFGLVWLMTRDTPGIGMFEGDDPLWVKVVLGIMMIFCIIGTVGLVYGFSYIFASAILGAPVAMHQSTWTLPWDYAKAAIVVLLVTTFVLLGVGSLLKPSRPPSYFNDGPFVYWTMQLVFFVGILEALVVLAAIDFVLLYGLTGWWTF